LRILFLIAEADPLVKIGGLGDVGGSLPLALKALSNSEEEIDVRLALPYYGSILKNKFPSKLLANFDIPSSDGLKHVEAYQLDLKGVPIYLIAGEDISMTAPVYTSDALADGRKFAFYSLASMELTRRLNWAPDIIHANDWHTATALYSLALHRGSDPFYHFTSGILGVHNLPFMGAGSAPALAAYGLPPASKSTLPTWAQALPLPLGLLSADAIVAVSPSYSKEILTLEYGCGLNDILLERTHDIYGILNGLDVELWNPQTDNNLTMMYGADDLNGRKANKIALQKEFHLNKNSHIPIIALISRLDPQKGVDLIPEALRILASTPGYIKHPWQLIILGTGDAVLEAELSQLETEFPQRIRAAIRFDAALSHRIYGGADILLIPSRYEPCGLTQMIAMRYGCVPVARAIGGLRDTIQGYEQSPSNTGFLFDEATASTVASTLLQSLQIYQKESIWREIQVRGMLRDFSWNKPARQYLELYQKLINNRKIKTSSKV
jgi:starch synthase